MDAKALQTSWKAMADSKSADDLGEVLFTCLFSAPGGEAIKNDYFAGAAANTPQGRKHGAAVCTGIGKMLETANDPAAFEDCVKDFITKHDKRNVGGPQMDVMCVAFKDFLSKMGQSGAEANWVALLQTLKGKLAK